MAILFSALFLVGAFGISSSAAAEEADGAASPEPEEPTGRDADGDEAKAEGGEAVGEEVFPDRPEDPLVGTAPPLEFAPGKDGLDDRFNQRRVPAGQKDLQAIEQALADALPRALEALVCIQVGAASGSGIIVSESGLVLSAAHVVMEPGTKLNMILSDGRKVKGETLGLEAGNDAGMARILDEGTYPTVPLGDYASLALGHWCFSLGHSGGWDKARGGNVRLGRIIRMKDGTMQSDCKLIGGDSGGPLFDMHGRLIGINSRVGSNVEESLHCPMDVFVENDTAMRKGIVVGQEKPAFLGAQTSDREEGGGVVLGKILKRGPAARAGLEEGDVLVQAWARPIEDRDILGKLLESLTAGERVLFGVLRGGEGEVEDLWVRTGSRDGFNIMGL